MFTLETAKNKSPRGKPRGDFIHLPPHPLAITQTEDTDTLSIIHQDQNPPSHPQLPWARSVADVTRLLQAIDQGDGAAAEELLPLVYEDLRRVAALRMAAEGPGHTLQATALVHEAWLRIAGEDHAWQNRRHFFAAAAEAMRRILIERARRRRRARHGGGLERVDVDAIQVPEAVREDQLVAIDEALAKLEQEDPRRAEVVKLRCFVGLTNAEVAEAMGLSLATVERDWSFAKAWLFSRIQTRT